MATDRVTAMSGSDRSVGDSSERNRRSCVFRRARLRRRQRHARRASSLGRVRRRRGAGARARRPPAARQGTPDGRLRRRPADQRRDRHRARRPHHRLRKLGRPPAGHRPHPPPLLHRRRARPRRASRSTRSTRASTAPPPTRRRPTSPARRPMPRRRASRPNATARSPRSRRSAKQEYTNAVAQARQAQRRGRADPRRARDRADQPAASPPCPRRSPGGSAARCSPSARWSPRRQTDPLAQIQRLDPMFVDIQQSRRRPARAAPHARPRRRRRPPRAQVRLKLEDGSDYGQTGTVEFAEALVDTETGTVTLRARFPNPQGLLLPGMFVRAQLRAGDRPQRLPRAAAGGQPRSARATRPSMVVGPGNKAVQRTVTRRADAGRLLGRHRRAERRRPGDRAGARRSSRPGQPVKPVPANTPQRIVAAARRRSGSERPGADEGAAEPA